MNLKDAKVHPYSHLARRLNRQVYTINHKGTWCWVGEKLFCQEGLCCNCEIWRRKERELERHAGL